MKISPPHLRSLFLVVFLFSFFQTSIAQDSLATKTPMYYKLDSTSDSISAFGEKSTSEKPDIFSFTSDKSYLIYIIVALIVGSIFSVAFSSLGRKKEIEFKKWNLENREKLKNNKK